MSLRKLPEIKAFERPAGLSWDAPSGALSRWSDRPLAAEATDPSVISIYDVIGEDVWTGGGFTAKRAAGALRAIGGKPVTVAINSPGGDFFEGLAIYNLLREHPAEVTVRVMGLAASAASIIAMAGDRIEMGMGSFLMIHNAWAVVVGNQHDMRDGAATLAPFDAAMADIYAARSGQSAKDVAKLMDAETWLGAARALDEGFADEVVNTPAAPDATAAKADAPVLARRRLEATLARAGVARKDRAEMISNLLAAARDAGGQPAPRRDAGALPAADLQRLLETLKG